MADDPATDEAHEARTILVPLDGSSDALAVLPFAHALGRLTGATLRVLHVAGAAAPEPELLRRVGLDPAALEDAILEQALGDPVVAISRAAAAAGCTLIALTSHGRVLPAPGHVLGPVSLALFDRARNPLLFVRPDVMGGGWPGGAPHRLLLPLRNGPLGVCSTAWAMRVAGLAHAGIDVLELAGRGAPEPPSILAPPRYVDQPQQEWPAWRAEVEERFCQLLGGCPPVPIQFLLSDARGDPAGVIVDLARKRGADLIALVRGRRRPDPLAEAVIGQAHCPVLILPRAHPPELDRLGVRHAHD